jgi:Mn-containing catalase
MGFWGMGFTEEEIRRGLLEVLFRRAKENPDPRIRRDDLQRALGVPDEVLDYNLTSLRNKGLVEAEGEPWQVAYISSKGVHIADSNARSYCPNL